MTIGDFVGRHAAEQIGQVADLLQAAGGAGDRPRNLDDLGETHQSDRIQFAACGVSPMRAGLQAAYRRRTEVALHR